ncbi:hypothetical protein TNCV_2647191 [Trichonephila clavipes]|nr:hypothetical protein TNCV_2647191 [Trichonephila clavipes]
MAVYQFGDSEETALPSTCIRFQHRNPTPNPMAWTAIGVFDCYLDLPIPSNYGLLRLQLIRLVKRGIDLKHHGMSCPFLSSKQRSTLWLTGNTQMRGGNRRKLSFKNVSNVVVQLLHSIKYSMDVPFSNMAVASGPAVEKPGTKMSSFADKLRKPFKKRHSTVYHQPTSRVNKYLAQAIEARSVDQEKSTHINVITLCFKDSIKERQIKDILSLPEDRSKTDFIPMEK